MTKGSPDSQHELIVTGLTRCLRLAYPQAEYSLGALVPDLNLKPDVFVVHPDGRRWAYEVVNKNASVRKIEENHQKYAHAGVQDYWILWEARGPDKPLDDMLLAQSMWIVDETTDALRSYKLNTLHRALAALGEGALYVFVINKPLQGITTHWTVKLGLVGLMIYRFVLDQLEADRAEGYWESVPLPYVTFDEQGRPQSTPMANEFMHAVGSLAQVPSDRPIFAQDLFTSADDLARSPESVMTHMRSVLESAFAEVLERYSQDEVVRMMRELQTVAEEAEKIQDVSSLQEILEGYSYLEKLPQPLQDAFRTVLPPREVAVQTFEIKRWFEEDEHLRALLEAI